MHEAVQKIHESAHILREEHGKSDELGRLTDKAARVLRESGGIRLLQAKDSGGYQEHPKHFFEWVRAVAQYNPSAGWIAGVVGIHPFEIALMDPRVGEEIYGPDGSNPDVWVASPYAPIGRLKPVEGGYLFSTDVPYSTGTDHCDWVILNGIVVDANGNFEGAPVMRHVVLPRSDYEIVEGSWNVMGLSGTGSKNVRTADAFIPEYRTVAALDMNEGVCAAERAPSDAFKLPFSTTFASAIISATFGIARGALDAYREYVQSRVSAAGVVGKTDPFQQEALAEADLAAGIIHVNVMTDEFLEAIRAGETISRAQRLEFRRNQSRASQRVLESVDKVFRKAGSAAVWTDKPLERYWRDLMAGGSHICNIADTAYTSWANFEFQTGGPVNTMH